MKFSKQEQKDVFRVVGIVLCVFSLAFVIMGGFRFMRIWSFQEKASRTQGKVVEMVSRSFNNKTLYAPVFVFTDAAGKEYKIQSDALSNSPLHHHVGETVTVLYDPADPKSARIDSFSSLWSSPRLFSCVGALGFIIGAIFYNVGRRPPNLTLDDYENMYQEERSTKDPPPEITELVTFLEEQGLTLVGKRGPDRKCFGNLCLEYAHDDLIVQIVKDRSVWFTTVMDPIRPYNGYDVALVRDLVQGTGSEDSLSFREQVKIIKSIWPSIRDAFSSVRRQATNDQLDKLAHERAKRIFPSWTKDVLDLEAFLTKEGLTCQHRDAPEGSFGERLMQYFDSVIGIRVTCGAPGTSEGWRVAVADATQPDIWYDVSLIRCIIEKTNEQKIPYLLRFQFVEENWAQIRQLFCEYRREATRARLQKLLGENTIT